MVISVFVQIDKWICSIICCRKHSNKMTVTTVEFECKLLKYNHIVVQQNSSLLSTDSRIELVSTGLDWE